MEQRLRKFSIYHTEILEGKNRENKRKVIFKDYG